MGDGAYYEGEPDHLQYGQTLRIDWGFMAADFNKYDWLGEGDRPTMDYVAFCRTKRIGKSFLRFMGRSI